MGSGMPIGSGGMPMGPGGMRPVGFPAPGGMQQQQPGPMGGMPSGGGGFPPGGMVRPPMPGPMGAGPSMSAGAIAVGMLHALFFIVYIEAADLSGAESYEGSARIEGAARHHSRCRS